MSRQPHRPLRLYVFPLFLTAAVVLAAGFLAQANGYSGPLRLEAGPVTTLAFIVCAYMVGQGVGEWRGLRYSNQCRQIDARSGASVSD